MAHCLWMWDNEYLGVLLCAHLHCVYLKANGSKWEDKHASLVMGSCPAPIIDPHLKPHENYCNELSDLNVNLIPAGEPAHLTAPLGVKSTVHDVQWVYVHVQFSMVSLQTVTHLMSRGERPLLEIWLSLHAPPAHWCNAMLSVGW